MASIVQERVYNGLLGNLTLGIIGGGLMEVGYAAFRRLRHPFCLMLPAAALVMCRAQHNLGDLFAYMIADVWHPWLWGSALLGNIIGALTLSIVNFDKFGKFTETDYDFHNERHNKGKH